VGAAAAAVAVVAAAAAAVGGVTKRGVSQTHSLLTHAMNFHSRQRTPGRIILRDRCRFLVCALIPVVLAATFVLAADPPTSDRVIAQFVTAEAHRASQAPRYTAIRHYTLDYTGFPSNKHAEMTVKVVSAPPAARQLTIVSESGSKLLLTRVLHKLLESELEAGNAATRQQLALTPDNYNFRLIGNEPVAGRPCYVLEVEPRKKSKFLYEGKIWVDAQDFAVVQISAKPAKNPSFWISSVQIDHRYAKHGDVWLPQSNRSRSKVRLGGSALLTIDYEQYEFAVDYGDAFPRR
jgi:hypothetical protein